MNEGMAYRHESGYLSQEETSDSSIQAISGCLLRQWE
jgi:hypothetical protein